MYQHDVPEKDLKESLDFVVEKCVNSVGVNINTAGIAILKYVSGLTKKSIEKIIDYRNKNGKINSREEMLKKEKILTPKAYEQAIGFLKVQESKNPLDRTSIHPESYKVAENLLDKLGMTKESIGTKELIEKLEKVDKENLKDELKTDIYTLEDIIESLKKPNLDPRDNYPQPILKSNVLDLKDLHIGDKLEGTVRNVVDFGLFIDIGLHEDGLAHISKLSHNYIKNPRDLYSVGDIVTCYVDNINIDKKKVALRLFND